MSGSLAFGTLRLCRKMYGTNQPSQEVSTLYVLSALSYGHHVTCIPWSGGSTSSAVTTSPVFPGQVALQVLQSPRHLYSLVRWLYKFCSHHVTCIPWSGGSTSSAVTTSPVFPGQVALQVLQSPRHLYSLVRWLYKFCSHHVVWVSC